jgi:diadenosine tetraphosphate (Ap4A) HIT family hydrolase
VAGCYACDRQADAAPTPREDVVRTDHWVVAHAFNSTLPGWLVLVARGHLTAFTDLSPAAADELGGLVRRLSVALERVTGCVKTYLMQFSEQDGFSHLHLHLVPRLPEHPEETRGPKVFAHLADDPGAWLPEQDRDEIALAVREALP